MFRIKASKLLDDEHKLPILPDDIRNWIEVARPIVNGMPRNFLIAPFWEDVYNDNHSDIMIVNGRQTFKSTFCTDVLAYQATHQESVEVCYVTHDEISLRSFSNQRLKIETFMRNHILKKFLRHGTGTATFGEETRSIFIGLGQFNLILGQKQGPADSNYKPTIWRYVHLTPGNIP